MRRPNSGYSGEVEQRFRGSGTRFPAKWNAGRSVATFVGQFPPLGVAADLQDSTRDAQRSPYLSCDLSAARFPQTRHPATSSSRPEAVAHARIIRTVRVDSRIATAVGVFRPNARRSSSLPAERPRVDDRLGFRTQM